jgi:hypothetical protein
MFQVAILRCVISLIIVKHKTKVPSYHFPLFFPSIFVVFSLLVLV